MENYYYNEWQPESVKDWARFFHSPPHSLHLGMSWQVCATHRKYFTITLPDSAVLIYFYCYLLMVLLLLRVDVRCRVMFCAARALRGWQFQQMACCAQSNWAICVWSQRLTRIHMCIEFIQRMYGMHVEKGVWCECSIERRRTNNNVFNSEFTLNFMLAFFLVFSRDNALIIIMWRLLRCTHELFEFVVHSRLYTIHYIICMVYWNFF